MATFEDQFQDAEKIASVVWAMRLVDLNRANNRTRIDELFNGFPPYKPQEVVENRINTNVNDLTATRSAHAMRRQFSQAFLKPGNFFTVRLNSGPKHKRRDWSQIITEEINARMKRGINASKYQEMLRNTFANVTLHGVGPVAWEDRQGWCPKMHSMGDVMLPSMTYRDMSNLSYYAIYRRYTAAQLYRLTHGPKVDKAWDTETVDSCIQWALKQWGQTFSGTDIPWNPERWEESIKANMGFYSSDQVPTINCWDFRYTDLNEDNYGWKRKIILDAPTSSDIQTPDRDILGKKGSLIYDSGARNYADKLSETIHFQFADGSVVAPFLYHSVRSLGFLLYSVCHLQNRLYCKFNDSVFESLLNYFRVTNPGDEGRIDKIDLINLGVIPEGWNFITQAERWKVDQNLVEMAMQHNRGLVNDSAAAYNQNFGENEQGPEKTATQITAELNATSSMVGSMLQDAYGYQEFQYAEIARRFCIPNSKDPDSREFRKNCLRRGVPEEYLRADLWDVAADRVIGSGNKQLEAASVQMLMQQINRYDPDSQREILRLYTFAATDDASLTDDLVPEQQNAVTDSIHDAQVSAAAMLMGLPLGLKQGVNHGEYAATLLGMLKTEIDKFTQSDGMASADDIAGMQNLAGQTIDSQPIQGNGAANHIAILAQDETSKQDVKQLSDALGKLMNEVKAFAQRLQEAQGSAQGPQMAAKISESMSYKDVPDDIKRQMEQAAGFKPSVMPETDPKVQKTELALKTKAVQLQQKLEHNDAQFRVDLQQKEEAHAQELEHKRKSAEVDVAAQDLQTAASIKRDGLKANEQESKP